MIIKFRYPKGKTTHQEIERRYGKPLLNLFRKFKNFDLKIRKSLCDIEFLNVCLENEITPKFLNFQLYRKDLRNTSQFQKCNDQLKSIVSFLDFLSEMLTTRK